MGKGCNLEYDDTCGEEGFIYSASEAGRMSWKT